MGVRPGGSAAFERLDGRRHEPDFVERGLALAAPGEFQVAAVDRVKAAAENAEAHEGREPEAGDWGLGANGCIVSKSCIGDEQAWKRSLLRGASPHKPLPALDP